MKGRIIVECVPNIVPNGMKYCGECDTNLPEDHFYRKGSVCKVCFRKKKKVYREMMRIEQPEEFEAKRVKDNEHKRAYYRRKTDLESVAKAWRHPWEKI